ncbi:hypothetical protein M8C21_021425 [Ambrosia artemisiifolia]|uniref:PGG domain-containing protein n=1 Tax=Ambrosia artemisiifolia TaxID=4212 RepID=A0AAD5D7N0_AMBAR|nr:hypothetical protein M8C21_021425 [Ambrosia artemisiifolia]
MSSTVDEVDLERGIFMTPSMQNYNSKLLDPSPALTASGKIKYVKHVIGRYNDTQLHLAAYRGDLASVKRILDEINSQMVGTLSGADCDAEVAKIRAAMVNEVNELGETALYIAAEKGHLEVVKELLKYSDKDTLTTSHLDFDPLHIAASQGHTAVVEELLSKDSSLLYIVKSKGKNALHLAARSGHVETVKSLLEKDPQLGRRTDKKGQTALHMAAKGANSGVVKLLLEADAAIVMLPDNSGLTALHVATRKKRLEIVNELLCLPDMNVNALNRDHKTALDVAEELSSSEKSTEIRAALVCHGAFRANELEQPRDELRKLHRKEIKNDGNYVTIAVLFAGIAYAAIFTVPGGNNDNGMAVVVNKTSFKIFFIFNAFALYTSLATVVMHVTLGITDETDEKRRLVVVINKLMWLASVCTSVAYMASTYIVIGRKHEWVAIYTTVVGASIMMLALGVMTHYVHKWRITKNQINDKGH